MRQRVLPFRKPTTMPNPKPMDCAPKLDAMDRRQVGAAFDMAFRTSRGFHTEDMVERMQSELEGLGYRIVKLTAQERLNPKP